MTALTYKASPTFTKFHHDDTFIRCVMGCVGSGKSVGCCWEVYLRALKQKPNSEGKRLSRWVIVRNTLPELETTTMATWKQWFGEDIFHGAKITGRAPYKQTITHEHPTGDGTVIHLELIFLALDGQEDVKKLMSLECTGIFFNEMRFIDEVIFREACTRPGRYPRKIDGGATWHGIIADTNPPDDSHWIYKLAEEIKPANFKMFYQPSGLSPQAENKDNLPDGYYENMSIGKSKEWINVYVHGRYGFMQEGKSVYAECWNDDFHYTSNPINIIPGRTLVGGIDASGRSPAAVVTQTTPTGQVQVIWELNGEDVGAVMFSKLLRQEVANHFPKNNITWWGDPAGAFKSQNDERTYFEILRGEGIIVQPSPGFRPNDRIEGVRSILSRNIGGVPALLLGSECKMLRKGFNGGYRYKKIGASGSAKYTPDPEKNEYSHCFAQGTLVSTPEGKKKIENIAVGDFVSTPAGYKMVTNTMQKQSQVVNVIVGDKKITCTPEHKFATFSGYSRADELQYASLITEDMKWAGKLFMQLKNLQESNSIKDQTGTKRLALTTLKEHALSAIIYLLSISTARQKRAVKNVQPLYLPQTVYDLTVEDAHCFYANGVLVSNCHDALQYCIAGLGELNTMKNRQRTNYKTYSYDTDW